MSGLCGNGAWSQVQLPDAGNVLREARGRAQEADAERVQGLGNPFFSILHKQKN